MRLFVPVRRAFWWGRFPCLKMRHHLSRAGVALQYYSQKLLQMSAIAASTSATSGTSSGKLSLCPLLMRLRRLCRRPPDARRSQAVRNPNVAKQPSHDFPALSALLRSKLSLSFPCETVSRETNMLNLQNKSGYGGACAQINLHKSKWLPIVNSLHKSPWSILVRPPRSSSSMSLSACLRACPGLGLRRLPTCEKLATGEEHNKGSRASPYLFGYYVFPKTGLHLNKPTRFAAGSAF